MEYSPKEESTMMIGYAWKLCALCDVAHLISAFVWNILFLGCCLLGE